MKKKSIIIAVVVLLVVLAGGYLMCNTICNIAIEQWNSGNQVQAMGTFSSIRFFPTAASYVNEFEDAMTQQLTEHSWLSESCRWEEKTEVRYANWEYTFYDNGKGIRVDSSREYGEKATIQGPYDITYSYVYINGKVYIRIRSIDDNDYSVNFSTDENGEMIILSFDGLVQYRDDFSAKYTRNISYADSPQSK